MKIVQTLFFFTAFITNSYTGDFCYDEEHCNPYSWGDTFPSCHPIIGEHHSPINLDHQMSRNLSLEALKLEGFGTAQTGEWTLKNNGHSVVLQVGLGMEVRGGGLPADYTTLQLHFHWGSNSTNGAEHTVNGRRYPMEMHIVNMKTVHYPNLTAAMEDPTGIAVLGVFIDVAEARLSDSFSLLSNLVPAVAYKGKTVRVKPFPLSSLLPMNNMSQYYRYHGSLTTPPCSKAVVWTVYEVPIYISYKQLSQFVSGVYHSEEGAHPSALLYNNFRHIHDTFSRKVYASTDATLLSSANLTVHSLLLCLASVLSAGLP
ncbi:carbonic anhydrase 15 [Conger conger]|uniref:carbonic anhydrase 15 n=1 Tax=Conger conger TaxID=82655 RepID=UPI002A598BD0|nr:carbonic anhydrase 15 [Conger conger]